MGLPEPNKAGEYWWRDGSAVFRAGPASVNAGKWVGMTPDDRAPVIGATPEEAAAMLAQIGYGPGRTA